MNAPKMDLNEPVSDLARQSLGKRLSTHLSFVDYTQLSLRIDGFSFPLL